MATCNPIPAPDTGIEQRANEIRRNLRKLTRSNWTLWILAIVIALALTLAVATLSMTVIFDVQDPFYIFRMSQAVRGLVGMVLIFSVYTLYQQMQLMQARKRLAQEVEISTEQHLLAESYLKLAMLDPLTGLHNRRYAQERLLAEMSRAERLKSTLTVLMIDLDELKKMNDAHGHAAGDLALKTFSERLSRAIRGSDLAVRIGGDEFVVLLPECDTQQVKLVLERLANLTIELESGRVAFQYSAGWTDYKYGETQDELLNRADHALYTEKQSRKPKIDPVVV
jgi:diguanylate cyclase (GGDEF)-like protein